MKSGSLEDIAEELSKELSKEKASSEWKLFHFFSKEFFDGSFDLLFNLNNVMQILLGKIDKRANDHQRVELKIVAGQIGKRGPPGPVGYPGPKGFEVR